MKMQVNVLEIEYVDYDKQSGGEGKLAILLTALTLPRFCACHKIASGFPTPYVEVFVLWFKVRGGCSFC